jgi:nucleoside-diphosphate-sugar epimerase
MIIGKGLLAKAFNHYLNDDSILIFASGVSNSKETDSKEFNREKELLEKSINLNKSKLFVYFSTCSIEDLSQRTSFYIKHKINMENIVKNKCSNYHIFRLPQVVGISKSPTIINFFVDSICNNKSLIIYEKATRNLISVEDVFKISKIIIENKYYLNSTINIATPFNIPVIKIANILGKLLNKQINCEIINLGIEQKIDISDLESIGIDFVDSYVEKILESYLIERDIK